MAVNAPHGRPRDSQRAKLYAAEQTLWRAQPMYKVITRLDVASVQRFVDRVTRSTWTRGQFPKMPRKVIVGTRRGRTAVAHGYGIDMPARTRFDMLILHELAHCVDFYNRSNAWHGREFAAAYLLLVRHFMGKKAHDALRVEFRTHGVKYLAKRKSTAAKTGNLAGLQKARAAKAAKKLGAVLDTALAKLPLQMALKNGSVMSFIESRTPDPLRGLGDRVEFSLVYDVNKALAFDVAMDMALARANGC